MRGACGVIADCTDRWKVQKHPSAFAKVLHKQRDDATMVSQLTAILIRF